MARSTLPRDFDIGRILAKAQADIAELRRRMLLLSVASLPAQAEASAVASQAISSTTYAVLPTPVLASIVLPGACVVRMDLQAISGVGGGATTDIAILGIAATGPGVSVTPPASGFDRAFRGQNFPILSSGSISQTVTTTGAGTLTVDVRGMRASVAATVTVRGVRLVLTPLRWA